VDDGGGDGVRGADAWVRTPQCDQRTSATRTAIADLERYLTTNRERMRYQTFRAAGYAIGSGADAWDRLWANRRAA